MADRYLVALARDDCPDFYVLTPEQWERFKILLDEGNDVCMAVSRTVEGTKMPYHRDLESVFAYVRKHRHRLVSGELGIGY